MHNLYLLANSSYTHLHNLKDTTIAGIRLQSNAHVRMYVVWDYTHLVTSASADLLFSHLAFGNPQNREKFLGVCITWCMCVSPSSPG